MSFFDIAMMICLLSDPTKCQEHRIQFESYGSLNECLLEAQFYIAQWKGINPQYDVKTWRCEYAQSGEDDDSDSPVVVPPQNPS